MAVNPTLAALYTGIIMNVTTQNDLGYSVTVTFKQTIHSYMMEGIEQE
jgi:hypothetical protein